MPESLKRIEQLFITDFSDDTWTLEICQPLMYLIYRANTNISYCDNRD